MLDEVDGCQSCHKEDLEHLRKQHAMMTDNCLLEMMWKCRQYAPCCSCVFRLRRSTTQTKNKKVTKNVTKHSPVAENSSDGNRC